MIAELLAVGTELLLGQIANTDAQFLSRRLSALGIDVYHHIVVGDNPARMEACLEQALSRADIVITSGGLGPTQDDITKEVVAGYCGLPMERDAQSEQRLRAYFAGINHEMTANNLRQIYFPKGCTIVRNDYGTAPGCIVEHKGKRVIVLPGPPAELEGMFIDQIEPYLRSRQEHVIQSKMLRVFGLGESKVEDMLKDLIDSQQNPTIAPYASFGEMSLRLTVKCAKGEDAQALLRPLESEVRRRLGEAVYAQGDVTLEETVAQMLLAKKKTIATAESCTGGMIASMLIEQAGISAVFLEGYVTYSDQAKTRTLGVAQELLAQHGAVSEQVAMAMARGARERAGSDVALAVTGIAGPGGGTQEKPVGLVWLGLADDAGARAVKLHLRGTRERIRRMSALHALNEVRRMLM